MPAFTTVLQQAMSKTGYDAMGVYLPNTTVLTALSTSAITAPQILMNGLGSNNDYLGAAIWRPGSATANGADWVRHIASIVPTTGAGNADVAWTDGTLGAEDAYLLPPGIEPYMVIGAAQTSLRNHYIPQTEPLSIKPVGTNIADAGLQNSATSAYTSYGTLTFTKDNTANSENIFPTRYYSGKIVTTAINSGILQQFALDPGERFYVHNLSRLSAGTSSVLELSDGTSTIGTNVSHALRKWQYMRRAETMTTGKTTLTVRQIASGNADTLYLNGVHVMPANTRYMALDTRWDTRYKADLALRYVELGPGTASNVYDATATTVKDVPPHLYKFVMQGAGANPSALQLEPGIEDYIDKPLVIEGRRALSDLYAITMADVTTSIPGNLDLMDALFRVEFYSRGDVQRVVPDWPTQLQRASWEANQKSQEMIIDTTTAEQYQMSRWGGGI